ncbi:MAG: hypothetical protein ACLUVV_07505 [Christensenellales bacterium]
MARTKKQAKPNRKPHWMDLPIELRVGQPRITLVGSGPVFVENHSGLLAYTTKRIHSIRARLLTITGTHLTLDCMASAPCASAAVSKALRWRKECADGNLGSFSRAMAR